MTSSNSLWSASGGDTGLRATRWAPAELHQEPTSGDRSGGGSEDRAPVPTSDPVEEARVEAYALGLLDGQRQESEKLTIALESLAAAVDEVRDARPSWIDNAEKNLFTLAVAVARQILGRELTTDPDTVKQLVSRAITRFPLEEPLTIRLHPSDLSHISAAALEGPGSDPAAGRDVRWRADGHIDEGSCVVEGPERMVDGRVDKALLRIYQALVTDEQELGDR